MRSSEKIWRGRVRGGIHNRWFRWQGRCARLTWQCVASFERQRNTRREDMLSSQHLRGPISYVVGRVLAAINQPAPFHVVTRAPWNVIIYGCSLAWQQFRNVSSRHLRDSVWPLWIRVVASNRPGNHRRRNHDRPVHRVIDNERGNLWTELPLFVCWLEIVRSH